MNAVTNNQNKKKISDNYVWKNKCELCGGRTASTMCPADIDYTYYCAVCIQDVEEQNGFYDDDDDLFQSLLADAEAYRVAQEEERLKALDVKAKKRILKKVRDTKTNQAYMWCEETETLYDYREMTYGVEVVIPGATWNAYEKRIYTNKDGSK